MIVEEFQDPAEEEDWRRLTLEQFLAGYAEGDTIYDQATTVPASAGYKMKQHRNPVDEGG